MLEIMLPAVFPVQAPVQAQVQAPVAVPVVVNVPLVAAGVQQAAVVQAPAGVQQLVGQLQDLVVQHVAVVEDDNETLKRLFLKKFGRELPETERNEVDDIDMNLIDLTKDEDEMEVATSEVVQVVVKTEPIEAAPIDDRRRSSRLRKNVVIQEKEAPLAAENNVIADADTDMAEDTSVGSVNAVESVNSVESGNIVEPLTADEAFEMAEAAIAESDAAIKANQMVIDGFYNTE
jgi:hypothetical protein